MTDHRFSSAEPPRGDLLIRAFGRVLALILVSFVLTGPVRAADLRMGIDVGPSTIDPHFHNFGPDKSLSAHIFDALVARDALQRPVPGLATSWTNVDPTTWEFRLRPGVVFSDGVAFTAADVAFAIHRASTIPATAFSSFALYTKPIAAIATPDPLTVRITTTAPFPLLPVYLSMIAIISEHVGKDAVTADYEAGPAAVGTGPYRFVSWQRGASVTLARNASAWGRRPEWDRVLMTVMPNAASRLAALLAGDVDVISNVATSDIRRLETDQRVEISRGISPLLVSFFPDHLDRPAPQATDISGKPLTGNPFHDVRVRRAVSLAIDRAGLVERVMDGIGSPTAQFMPEGFFSSVPDIAVPAADPAAARALLAEAGYPEGFGLTIQCPNDRIVNAEKICLAVAQMLTRVGIRTKVETMPQAVFIPPAQRHEFSLFMHGMSTEIGEASSMLIPTLATADLARGRGTINRGSYANPAFDALLDQSLTTLDDSAREDVLRQATHLLTRDVALIPVLHQVNTWATRAGLVYVPNGDEFTVATRVHPKPAAAP